MDNSYIIKRDGSKVLFDAVRIRTAIEKALVSTQQPASDSLIITQNVCSRLWKMSNLPSVEQCQDIVEDELMKSNYRSTAKAYILYREERSKRRQCLISEDWKLQAKEAASYFGSAYQYIVYLRTYAKWLADKNRRETWPETVTRFMNFMREIVQDKLDEHEYEELERAILRMEVMPSMRLLQFAGEAVRRNNVCAYNCSFVAPTSLTDLHDTMMVLMCGTGAGFSVERKYIDQLPTIEKQIGLMLPPHTVEDSREGWCNAFLLGLETWYQGKDIQFDYSLVRPAGARLKTTGGRASGPAPLKDLLNFSRELILNNQGGKLSTINVHDLMCKIGGIVVVGGVRRSAELSLSDLDDEAMRNAKAGAFWNTHPDRSMANNSAVYNKPPTDIELLREWTSLVQSGTGERGIFNRSHMSHQLPKRRVELLGDLIEDMGTNPCAEIFLLPSEFCNLTSVVLREDDTRHSIISKVRLSTILGTYQSMLTDFKDVSPRWKELVEKERLLGVSLNGQCDCKYLRDHIEVLDELKVVAIETNKEYANRFGINPSSSITCVKPEGTTSQMLNTSSGLHPRFAPYYIRRLRISATDALSKLLIDQGIPHSPENGQTVDTITTWVFDFPQRSPEGAICAKDVSAIKQLNYWKELKTRYTEHNPSCTIYVKPDEWVNTLGWVKENWNIIGGLSFLPLDDHIYQLAPYEELTEEEFERRDKEMPEIDFSKLILFEKEDGTERKQEWACVGGSCELK